MRQRKLNYCRAWPTRFQLKFVEHLRVLVTPVNNFGALEFAPEHYGAEWDDSAARHSSRQLVTRDRAQRRDAADLLADVECETQP